MVVVMPAESVSVMLHTPFDEVTLKPAWASGHWQTDPAPLPGIEQQVGALEELPLEHATVAATSAAQKAVVLRVGSIPSF